MGEFFDRVRAGFPREFPRVETTSSSRAWKHVSCSSNASYRDTKRSRTRRSRSRSRRNRSCIGRSVLAAAGTGLASAGASLAFAGRRLALERASLTFAGRTFSVRKPVSHSPELRCHRPEPVFLCADSISTGRVQACLRGRLACTLAGDERQPTHPNHDGADGYQILGG